VSGYRTVTATVTNPKTGASAPASGSFLYQDGRFGASVPLTPGVTSYPAALANFQALTGKPLTLYRVEGLGSPVPASFAATRLQFAPPGCRLLVDVLPLPGGGDNAAVASLCESIAAAGFTDTIVSVNHEEHGLDAADFISVFQQTAPLIRAAGLRTAYCLDGYEIVHNGALEPYNPGDEYVDVHYHDFYPPDGLQALTLAAAFADAHGKTLGACEYGLQVNEPTGLCYLPVAEAQTWMTNFADWWKARRAANKPVGDLSQWQGINPDGGNFTLPALGGWAVTAWQNGFTALDTTPAAG
jgi:hypothetical protein